MPPRPADAIRTRPSPTCRRGTWSARGSSPVRLTSGGYFDRTPALSPDGQKILFTSNRSGNNDVWTMNANGSGLTNLTKAPGGDYNPDQRRAPTG